MQTAIIGYPRIGSARELKFAEEAYFRGDSSEDALNETARTLRLAHWTAQQRGNIDWIPSNDFSLYDPMLDMACLLGVVPRRHRELRLSALDTYFAMARGYQGPNGDARALAMKKWFNTNYHYLVPELEDDTEIHLNASKPFDEYLEAKQAGIRTRPVLIGAFTFLKLARCTGKRTLNEFAEAVAQAYAAMLRRLDTLGVEWVQFDEPFLVMDLTAEDLALFSNLYRIILQAKGYVHVLAQTYFGDIRDSYATVAGLDFDGIGLDFVEGRLSRDLIRRHGWPKDKVLFAGVVNGKNIWRNRYDRTLELVIDLRQACSSLVLSTSCSLLHVPYTLQNETGLEQPFREHFAFAEEKLRELRDLGGILDSTDPQHTEIFRGNVRLFENERCPVDAEVRQRTGTIPPQAFVRQPAFDRRQQVQKDRFRLPPLPTTTIGSFPQTTEVKSSRAALRKGAITAEQHEFFIRREIAACVAMQEQIGLDVLVHGEFERNDMVEYFGTCLNGFLFLKNAWVQSYGTRCVKPPVIWADISRGKPMTVAWSTYAQSLTTHPVKGMLTGPITILNWSFPREDLPAQECALQLALAIRDEVLDLEANGIAIIQIDEAALREKLPLRRSDWQSEYLDWAIPAFRLVHSGVRPETQIHTHMCYSEFTDIIRALDDMDADVITFEASRSDLLILDALREARFRTAVGPGVYDIHSPRVPSVEEICGALKKMLTRIPKDRLWVNPDCGLKTRGYAETWPSLRNMVQAAKEVRDENSAAFSEASSTLAGDLPAQAQRSAGHDLSDA